MSVLEMLAPECLNIQNECKGCVVLDDKGFDLFVNAFNRILKKNGYF